MANPEEMEREVLFMFTIWSTAAPSPFTSALTTILDYFQPNQSIDSYPGLNPALRTAVRTKLCVGSAFVMAEPDQAVFLLFKAD